MFLGQAGSTPVWAPGSRKPQELILWTASNLQRLRLGSPVGTVLPGDHGWAPSLLVEREVAPRPSPVLADLPVERRPLTFVRRSSAPRETRLITPSGEVQVEGTVASVSPDGRFVISIIDDEDARSSVRVTDLQGGTFHEMDFQGVPGSPNGLIARSHCWARVDDTPVYIAVVLTASSPHAINTWSAVDGSLIASTPISTTFESEMQSLLAMNPGPAGGAEGPVSETPRPLYTMNSFATSADGRFVAASGNLFTSRDVIEREQFLLLNDQASSVMGVVVLYERATGEMLDVFVHEHPVGPLAISNDGARVAALLASEGNGLGTASVGVFPNRSLDAGDDPLAHVVRDIDLPGSYLMPSELIGKMSRSSHGQLLSFTPDGQLLSVALDKAIHLIDVPGRMLVDSLDWPRIVPMIELEGEPSQGVRLALQASSIDYRQIRFEGAAFSRDGRELRVDLRNSDIAMVRIRDTAWN